jgi:hypothetical protein
MSRIRLICMIKKRSDEVGFLCTHKIYHAYQAYPAHHVIFVRDDVETNPLF